jgi:hypothetical protein
MTHCHDATSIALPELIPDSPRLKSDFRAVFQEQLLTASGTYQRCYPLEVPGLSA